MIDEGNKTKSLMARIPEYFSNHFSISCLFKDI